MNRGLFLVGFYMAALVALIDQLTKSAAVDLVTAAKGGVRVTSFFNVTIGFNKGVTFGFLNNHGAVMPYVLLALAVAVSVFLLLWMRKAETMKESLGIGLVLGGAVGNIIDRARLGAVVDFLDFHYDGYHWYTFNFADAAIVCGVGLLLLDQLLRSRRKDRTGTGRI